MPNAPRVGWLPLATLTIVCTTCAGRPSSAPGTPPAPLAPDSPAGLNPDNDPKRSLVRDIEEEPWSPIQADFPVQASVVTAPFPAGNTTNKSLSIRLGPHTAVNFDTDLLRMAAGWTGDFLTPKGVTFDTTHGGHPQVAGDQHFGTAPVPGWADVRGGFADPREIPFGPLPAAWARWDGHYIIGDNVVLAYTVHGTKIHEQPSAIEHDGATWFVRTFHTGPIKKNLRLLVADAGGSTTDNPTENSATTVVVSDQHTTVVGLHQAPANTRLTTLAQGRIVLDLPASKKPQAFSVLIGVHPGQKPNLTPPTPATLPRMADFKTGGTRHWPHHIVTKGVVSKAPGPYVVDRITTPFPGVYRGEPADWQDNVFRRRIMIGGFDFFSDGKRAAVSTWEGDVWIVTGIDGNLDRIEWHRFASGLFEPLGLKIVDDVIYVSGRDQITRLHDSNGDGEADHYENFNNQVTNSQGFHEFQFDLDTDAQGNFYTAKAGPVRGGGRDFGGGGGNGEITPFAGTLHKVSKDGKRREIFATGFRAPNGIGIGPQGQITTGDNEGSWMPASPLNWVRKGGFYGVEPLAHRKKIPDPDPPLLWISKSHDNSGGSQVWVTSDKWGPLKGELLHLSYGRAAIYQVMKQKVGNILQGGIVRVIGGEDATQFTGTPVKLTSSAMRARFNPVDGQLYVTGLAGWQTDAVSLTGFDRIRYTGQDVVTVRDLKVTSAGVHLTFSHKLDPSAADPQNFSGERWNYRRTSNYGSPEFSVEDPSRRGHDRLDIYGAQLSRDGKTITLQIADLRPVHQMLLKFSVRTEDGRPIKQNLMHTIHQVPRDPRARHMNVAVKRGRPGLVLALDNAPETDIRVVPGINLFVAHNHTASPFLPAGPFRATWKGTLTPELKGQYLIAADVTGTLTVKLDGKIVLQHAGDTPAHITSQPLAFDKAANDIEVVLSPSGKHDTSLRMHWARNPDPEEAALGAQPLFEPIPQVALRHEPDAQIEKSEARRLGRALFLESRCGNCHLDETVRAQAQNPELRMSGPSLNGIGSRRHWYWMQQWIRDPHNMRSSARMPTLLSGPDRDQDATAIAAYLASLRDPRFEAVRDVNADAVTDALTRLEANTVAGKTDDSNTLTEQLLCRACHVAQANGADDGRDVLDSVGARFKRGALAEFLRAPEREFPWIAMPNFGISQADAVQIEAALLMQSWKPSSRPVPTDPAVLEHGKTLLQTRGCLHCHELTLENRAPIVPLTAKTGAPNCIDGSGPAVYQFAEHEKQALRQFVAGKLDALSRHAPIEFAERQIQNLRCNNCHDEIDGLPPLDNIGEKLRPEWMAEFIAGRVPYKPRGTRHPDGHVWMEARMPAFPARAALLAEGLAARAGFGPRSPAEPPVNTGLAATGATLVSADGGFSCIGCHGSGDSPATQVFEAEGINFAYVAHRLRPDFFYRWLMNPMKIDPQTKMPSYFDTSGMSPLETVLDGRADAQIEAMWHHMRQVAHKPNTAPVANR